MSGDEKGSIVQMPAVMPVMDIASAVARYKQMVEFVKSVMEPGTDFGVVPGTDKPTLLKPGAEKLCTFFGLSAEFNMIASVEDWTGRDHGEPLFDYTFKCRLLRSGNLVAEGVGSCTSWEKKYRYRQADRICPICGKPAIIKGKEEYGGGWLCLTPETPILFADMSWRPIGDARVGDEIVGFDEYPTMGSQRRKFRRSVIEALWWNRKPTLRLVTDSGEVQTTAEHRWLEHHRQSGHLGHWGDPWKGTERLVVGNPLRSISMHETLPVTAEYRRGYLAGMTESDGTMRYDPSLTDQPVPYWRVALQSRDEIALGRLVAYLSDFGIEAWTRPFRGDYDPRHSPMQKVEIRARGRLSQLYGLIQPSESRDYMRGYLAGFFDGDGSGDAGRITIYNTKAERLARLTSYGRVLGFDLQIQSSAGDASSVRLHGGVRESMRFVATVMPALLRKAPLFGVSMQYDPTTIEAVESGPVRDVVDIQTSTGTYFAAGYATHNCFAKKGGCGAKWPDGAAEIESQTVGMVTNPDPADQTNTLKKMAQKRALVAATLVAVNASAFFTQDMEDIVDVTPMPAHTEQAKPEPVARPYAPDVLRKGLQAAAKKLPVTAEVGKEKRGLMAGMLEEAFAGEGALEKRHSVLRYLWGKPSALEMTGNEVIATLDWLKPSKSPDGSGAYHIADVVLSEIRAILPAALKEAGQQEFPAG